MRRAVAALVVVDVGLLLVLLFLMTARPFHF